MDERAEIWIARDPETDAESRAVSLRKLRKGLQISRLKPTTLVKRVGATEWVTLERLLADAALLAAKAATPPPPLARPATTPAAARPAPPRPRSTPPPRPASVPPPPVAVVRPSAPPLVVVESAEVEAVESPVAEDVLARELERAAAAAVPLVKPIEPRESSPPISAPPMSTPPISRPTPTPTSSPSPDESESLTVQWFMEPPPEPGDDEPIFAPQTSVLDLRFEHVGSVKLVRLAYVLVLATLACAVVASVVHALSEIANGQSAATALALVPVVALACAFVGAAVRMMLEVLLMLSRIADRLAALARAQGIR